MSLGIPPDTNFFRNQVMTPEATITRMITNLMHIYARSSSDDAGKQQRMMSLATAVMPHQPRMWAMRIQHALSEEDWDDCEACEKGLQVRTHAGLTLSHLSTVTEQLSSTAGSCSVYKIQICMQLCARVLCLRVHVLGTHIRKSTPVSTKKHVYPITCRN